MLNEKIIELGKTVRKYGNCPSMEIKGRRRSGPKRFLILVSEAPMFLVRTELHRII